MPVGRDRFSQRTLCIGQRLVAPNRLSAQTDKNRRDVHVLPLDSPR